ncbi:MAG: hypothetical protein EU548_08480, partial [Promethearchaeota archaeon]
MELGIRSVVAILISIFYGIFLASFIYESTRKNRSAPFLIHLLICGFIGSIFAILDGLEFLPNPIPDVSIYLIIELLFYGLQFFFFYLFLEEISSVRPKTWRLLIMFTFLIIQHISFSLMIWFATFSSQAASSMWLLADIGYNNLALFAFAIFGVPTYYKQYKYTRDKKSLVIIASLLLITLGYSIYSVIDYVGFFTPLLEGVEIIGQVGEVFPLLGLIIILLVYVSDIDYLYRLPSDHYMLIVTYKSGITIHSVKFKAKETIELKENFFSGFITSISFIFDKILGSEAPIETISSKDASILMRSGEKIIVIMLVKRPTKLLERAMDRYIDKFEETFQEELAQESVEINKFRHAEELISPIFPFLKIEYT